MGVLPSPVAGHQEHAKAVLLDLLCSHLLPRPSNVLNESLPARMHDAAERVQALAAYCEVVADVDEDLRFEKGAGGAQGSWERLVGYSERSDFCGGCESELDNQRVEELEVAVGSWRRLREDAVTDIRKTRQDSADGVFVCMR